MLPIPTVTASDPVPPSTRALEVPTFALKPMAPAFVSPSTRTSAYVPKNVSCEPLTFVNPTIFPSPAFPHVVVFSKAERPTAVLSLLTILLSASAPTAVLLYPYTLRSSAHAPTAVFSVPTLFPGIVERRAFAPNAVLSEKPYPEPVVDAPALIPKNVL